jgi:predicted lipoprotein
MNPSYPPRPPRGRTLILVCGFAVLLAASWLGLQACSIAASDLIATVDRRPLLKSLRDTVLIPNSERFAAKAAALEGKAADLAAHPGPAALDSARSAWKETALAWAALQAVRVGPIADQTPRIGFWPTRPNLIEQGLAASDNLDSNRLEARTPSAAKGLPALEWLLFSQPADAVVAALQDSLKGPRRGRYLAAAATDLRRAAGVILSEWKGATGAAFADPASGTRYPTSQMAVEELIKGLVASLEEMKNGKVLTPAGAKSEGRPQPDAVESPYAALSLDILAANLAGAEAAFSGQGPADRGAGLNAYMEDLGSAIPARLTEGFSKARAALAAVPPPLSVSVVNQGAKVTALGAALTDLVVTVKNDVASTLGFNITFTDNDGD